MPFQHWPTAIFAVALAVQLVGCGGEGSNVSSNGGVGGNPGGNGGTATLTWTAPATNEDGTAVVLSGFNVYVGNSPGSLSPVASVGPNVTSHTVNGLSAGTAYFAVTAVGANGVESARSQTATATIN